MAFLSDARPTLKSSLLSVDTLVSYAQKCGDADEATRKLFLKLAMVLLVTRLQVFVEQVLKEFSEYLCSTKLNYESIPIYAKVNSMRLVLNELALERKISDPHLITPAKFDELRNDLCILSNHFEPMLTIDNLRVNSSFPLGRTGAGELISLFKQFEGKNIFDEKKFDTDKLNSLLFIRHSIIHQDSVNTVTEQTVIEHKIYIEELSDFVVDYLEMFLKRCKKEC